MIIKQGNHKNKKILNDYLFETVNKKISELRFEKWLSVLEACNLLGISISTYKNACKTYMRWQNIF